MDDVNDGLDTFDGLMQQGLLASATDQGERAIELFSQASALAPAAGMPHFLIGAEHAAMENFAAAEIAFADAILLAPAMAIARYQLGLLQFSMMRTEIALRTWKPLLDIPEPNPYRGFIHGFAALAQEDPKAARFHFNEGLAKNEAFQEASKSDPQAGVISRMLSEALAGDIERVLAGLADEAGAQAARANGAEAQAQATRAAESASADNSSTVKRRKAPRRAQPGPANGERGKPGAAGNEADDGEDGSAQSKHFLLSNYSPQGRPN